MSATTRRRRVERVREPASSGSRTVVLVTMCIGYFVVLLDVTVVNVALPHIASGLSAV
jgi:DHA2 family methylenomycin A resistance protein-like MFS transporter